MSDIRSLRQYIELYYISGVVDYFLTDATHTSEATATSQGVDNVFGKHKSTHSTCTKCGFHQHRVKFVYGEGQADSDVMIIGNPPNPDENMSGKTFFGKVAGLLDAILPNINLSRNTCYITNIVKCRAKVLDVGEARKCLHILNEQIDIVRPKVILVFGVFAANVLFDKNEHIDHYRKNQAQKYRDIPVFVTYNTAEMYMDTSLKKPAWDDLQLFRDREKG
jgi:DNA polymerase